MMPTIFPDSSRPERSKTVEKPGVDIGPTLQHIFYLRRPEYRAIVYMADRIQKPVLFTQDTFFPHIAQGNAQDNYL